jgi:hypothetical protein
MSDPVTISNQDLAAAAAAGNAGLLDAEINRCLDELAQVKGQVTTIAVLARWGLEPPDAEAQLAERGRRREAATARLAAARDAVRKPAGSRPT